MTPLHVVAAPDKFRGSATAVQVARAIAEGARAAGWTCRELPLADGGEGMLDAFGGPNRTTNVTGPLGAPVAAEWRLDGDRAVIEMARASGLALAGGKEGNDPLRATTRGTGELIAAAIEAGARHVIVGVGGSATTDGGLGALEALAATPFAEAGVDVQVACDVQTTFVDAAAVFAPQKGATPEQVAELTERLRSLGSRYRAQFGVDVARLPGSGAAGGLSGGLAALGARLIPGLDLVADAVGLDAALADAQLVITGEGLLDATSFAGKVVGGVVRRASLQHVPVAAIVGEARVDPPASLTVLSLVERYGEERAWAETAWCIADAATAVLAGAR
ncbi:MAG TPA: glycerate kinase [Gaiellaceae bacterium]